jgi:hypothetical protein
VVDKSTPISVRSYFLRILFSSLVVAKYSFAQFCAVLF